MRRLGRLCAAAESGYRMGRSRRWVSPAELSRWSPRQRDAFLDGVRREAQARLEQGELELVERRA